MFSINKPSIGTKDIVVLQVVNSIDRYVLVEWMYKADYDAETICFNPDGSGKD